MTQRDFAAEIESDETAVSRWIHGKAAPERPTALRIETMSNGAVPIECWNPISFKGTMGDADARKRAHAALAALPDGAPDSTPVTLDAGALRHLMRQKRIPG